MQFINEYKQKTPHIYVWGVFMIVIQKKRILTLVSIVLITLFIANIKVNEQEDTIATVAIPVTNKVIVVDARTW